MKKYRASRSQSTNLIDVENVATLFTVDKPKNKCYTYMHKVHTKNSK